MNIATHQPASLKIESVFDKTDSVTLVVGLQKHELLAHAKFITLTSDFFKTALKKEWLEVQTRVIHLPEENVPAMVIYLKFIYTGQLPVYETYINSPAAMSHHEIMYVIHVRLYALAHRLMDNTTKNAALREMCKAFMECRSRCGHNREASPDFGSVNMIYLNTVGGDPARRLMVDMHMTFLRSLSPQYVAALLLDLAQGYIKRALNKLPHGSKYFDVNSYMV
jgi:hypothetical protein